VNFNLVLVVSSPAGSQGNQKHFTGFVLGAISRP